nr:unnamed protein product [Digitaria exilis]
MSLSPADGAAYWLRWQVLVCGALIALPAAAAAALLPRLRRNAAPLRATDLWVPCWARLHPGWLLGYRAFALAAAVALLARLLLGHGISVFYFYTQWTFLLVTIYFAFATAISAHGCWVYSKKSSRKAAESHGFLNDDVENHALSTTVSGETKKDETTKLSSYYEQIVNEKRAGFWGRCMQIIYQTSAGATMLTDVTFWGLLVPFFYRDKFGLALVTDGMHSLNAVFLLIDTVLNNMVALPVSGPFIIWGSSMVLAHLTSSLTIYVSPRNPYSNPNLVQFVKIQLKFLTSQILLLFCGMFFVLPAALRLARLVAPAAWALYF